MVDTSSGIDRDAGKSTPPGLTPAKAEEFRQLLQRECNVSLEPDQAWRRASQLIALYRMLMGPIPEDPGVRTSDPLPSGVVDRNAMVE